MTMAHAFSKTACRKIARIAALAFLKIELDQPVRMIGPFASTRTGTRQNDLQLCPGQKKTTHHSETTAAADPAAHRIRNGATAGAARLYNHMPVQADRSHQLGGIIESRVARPAMDQANFA